jgi:hypothetical protein
MYLKSDHDLDGLQQDAELPSISIQSQSWKGGSGCLQHSRSSSTIPATMNKQNSALRISFKWIGYKDSRIVIKVVKGSEVLFEIEDWTHPVSYGWSKIDRYYNCSHDYIKNLEAGCHFELHYAVAGNGLYDYLEIKDFRVCVEGKLSEDKKLNF